LPNGDSFNQYLFRLLMNRDRPGIVPGEYPRDTYKTFVIERRQDYNDLIELLDILHKISKNFLTDTNIEFPKTIEDLLYDVHQNQFGLLSDLDTDPSKYANYDHNDLFVIRHLRDFLMNVALETNAPSYQHPADSIPLLVKNLKEEIDLRAELEETKNLIMEGGPYQSTENYEDVDGISHDLLFYKIFQIFPNTDALINVMENYDEYYREVLNRYITKNYKHLKRMIIKKFENIIRIFQYGMEDGVGADIDEERTLADLGRIEYYLDSGNYNYVIDYIIELNYKVLRGDLNVTTRITDLIRK
jgi:hypothetical protein